MDPSGVPSPSSGTPVGAKGQAAQSGQRPKVKITPFHSSPIASSDGALRSKRPGAASGRLLEQGSPGGLSAPPVRERQTAAAWSSAQHSPKPGSVPSNTTAAATAQASPLIKTHGCTGY